MHRCCKGELCIFITYKHHSYPCNRYYQ